jgi:hypothetical protein
MTAIVVNLAAARTAKMLRQNAPPDGIQTFLAQMRNVARERRDTGREAFWHEVADLARARDAGRLKPAGPSPLTERR